MVLLPALANARTVEQATHNVVGQLKAHGLNRKGNSEIIIEFVNYHSRRFDRQARIIQGELFSALQVQFPDARILLKEEALVGISSSAVFIKGTYRAEGIRNIIELSAVEQVSGRLLAKADDYFNVERDKYESLVVVMPIDAPSLDKDVSVTFSKILRSALSRTGAFNLVSSGVVDSVDADEIQRQYQCSREECSTIVAEQVNANQVITPQYARITEGLFFLTASLKDIKTGRTIREEAIQHDGDIKTLPQELNNLATKLTGSGMPVTPVVPAPTSTRSTRTGMLVIKSIPTKAEIEIDGIKMKELTDALLQGIAVGKHTITVQKGLLGASKEVMILPDKAEEIFLNLELQMANLQITSSPNASVYLDGEHRGETPLIISTEAGEHQLEIKHNDYITHSESVVANPRRINRVDAQLMLLPILNVDSNPVGASVYVDGAEKGITPVALNIEPGTYEVELRKDGFQTIRQKKEIFAYQENRIETVLKKTINLYISVTPPGSWLTVDGKKVELIGEDKLTYKNHQESIEAHLQLPAGEYKLKAGHPQGVDLEKIDLILRDDRDEKWQTIQIDLSESQLDDLKQTESESDLIAWRTKFTTSLVGGILSGVYAYLQYQQALTARDEQKESEEAILSTTTSEEGSYHRERAINLNSEVKKCNRNSQTGILTSVVLFGISLWLWNNSPEEQTPVSWSPVISDTSEIGLSFNSSF